MFVMHGLKPEREERRKNKRRKKDVYKQTESFFFFNVLFQAESTMQGKAKI